MNNFLKSTIIGGLVFVIPFIIIDALLLKAIKTMRLVSVPIGSVIPVGKIAGIAIADLLVLISVIIICFLAGLAAKSLYVKRIRESIDSKLRLLIPGYAFIKGFTGGIEKKSEDEYLIPVMAKFDDSSQLGFEVERLDNGLVVVYLPGAPNPWSGNVVYMTEDRIEKLKLKFSEIGKVMKRIGIGSGEAISNSKINQI